MPYLPAYFRAYFLWSLYGHILKYAAKYAEKTTQKTLEIMGPHLCRELLQRLVVTLRDYNYIYIVLSVLYPTSILRRKKNEL